MTSSTKSLYTLHYAGGKRFVNVVPHDEFVGMYFLRWPDGKESDFGNLSRVKDAAEVLGGRGRDAKLLFWKRHHFQKATDASGIDLFQVSATTLRLGASERVERRRSRAATAR